jgi:hypothetical protein
VEPFALQGVEGFHHGQGVGVRHRSGEGRAGVTPFHVLSWFGLWYPCA